MALLRKIVSGQIALSKAFDRLLPEKFRVHGWVHFNEQFIYDYLKPNSRVCDIGGGKHPCLSRRTKQNLGLTIMGLDIDRQQLEQAPADIYDETVCADITRYKGRGDADIAICQTLLEHVRNVDEAFAGIASTLKPGGIALIFVPSRNALFARLNLLLSQRLKESLLYTIFPESRASQGFPAYYDRCTPRDFRRLVQKHGFSIVEERHYYISPYFQFFFPLHLVWRLWLLLFHAFAREQAAETFSLALCRTEGTIERERPEKYVEVA